LFHEPRRIESRNIGPSTRTNNHGWGLKFLSLWRALKKLYSKF
jgi:hypothetical protein